MAVSFFLTERRAGMDVTVAGANRAAPRKRPKHHSYDESVDEPAKLLNEEAVEIEEEIPAEDTEAVEQIEPADSRAPFEE